MQDLKNPMQKQIITKSHVKMNDSCVESQVVDKWITCKKSYVDIHESHENESCEESLLKKWKKESCVKTVRYENKRITYKYHLWRQMKCVKNYIWN